MHVLKKSKNVLICSVGGIKVDFVNYQYDMLEKPIIIDSIRLTSMQDIAAMKINAIAGRGSKKDFIDIKLILSEFNLQQIVDFYKSKYNQESEFMALKSMLYFADADLEVEPEMFIEFNWIDTKQIIKKRVEDYLNN